MYARKRRIIDHIGSEDDRIWIGFRIKPGHQRTLDFTQ